MNPASCTRRIKPAQGGSAAAEKSVAQHYLVDATVCSGQNFCPVQHSDRNVPGTTKSPYLEGIRTSVGGFRLKVHRVASDNKCIGK